MSTVYLYLKKEICELSGFKNEPYKDGSGNKVTFSGMHLYGGAGESRFHIGWDINATIPDELQNVVEEISCHETIPRMVFREPGIYRYDTAECELMPGDYGSSKRENLVYILKITAKNLEDIRAILHKVKTGTIRPEESYDGSQVGKSRQQLERDLEESNRGYIAVTETLGMLQYHVKELTMKNVSMRKFADKLGKRFEGGMILWPFVNRLTVAEKIIKILDSNE